MKRLFASILLIAGITILSSAQIFYKIEGNGLKRPSYIFGTHHLAPASVLDDYPSLKMAQNETEVVVGEIDMTVSQIQLALSMQKYMMAPSDSTLQALLSPEQLDSLDVKFAPYSPQPGIGLKHLGMMRPMVIATMVTLGEIQKSLPDFNAAEQLDASFQKSFKEAGKKVIPLETAEQQAELLYTFIPISKQLTDLIELLDNPGQLADNCKALNEAYLAGDLNALLKLTESDESDPAFMDALLTMRNKNWLDKLPAIIQEQPTLIVVGALHLAGPDGLVEGLRNMGYNVTPIK